MTFPALNDIMNLTHANDATGGRLQIGIPGRLRIGMHGRLRRNPQPDLVFASQAAPPPRTVVPDDVDLVFGTQVSSSGHEAPEVRRSDHKERLIDLLAQASMED